MFNLFRRVNILKNVFYVVIRIIRLIISIDGWMNNIIILIVVCYKLLSECIVMSLYIVFKFWGSWISFDYLFGCLFFYILWFFIFFFFWYNVLQLILFCILGMEYYWDFICSIRNFYYFF